MMSNMRKDMAGPIWTIEENKVNDMHGQTGGDTTPEPPAPVTPPTPATPTPQEDNISPLVKESYKLLAESNLALSNQIKKLTQYIIWIFIILGVIIVFLIITIINTIKGDEIIPIYTRRH